MARTDRSGPAGLDQTDARGARGMVFSTAPVLAIFAGTVAIGALLAVAALSALRSVSHHMDEVVTRHADSVIAVERLTAYSERIGRMGRAYALTQDQRFLGELHEARADFDALLARLATDLDGDGRAQLQTIRRLKDRYVAANDAIIDARGRGALDGEAIVQRFTVEVQPVRDALDAALAALRQFERGEFAEARRTAVDSTSRVFRLLVACLIVAMLMSALLAAVLLRTLTRLRRNRQALERVMVRLESANRDLDAFAGRVSHDLRNILTPLTMSVARLRSNAARPDMVDQFAERVGRSATRAQALIDTLLNFARAGQPADADARASVREAIDAALEDLEEDRRNVGADVRVEIADARVRCAPGLLHVVLLNLLGNAFKYLAGRERRAVRLYTRADDERCTIVVEDTGPGISAEARERIFRPFYRAPGAHGPGMGIGLATVQRIVQAHGGTIGVASEPGEWTRFTVTLPRAAAEDAPARAASELAVPAP